MKNIYDLKLNEGTYSEEGPYYLKIRRVPGGWLYEYDMKGTATFVPYNDEFKEEK